MYIAIDCLVLHKYDDDEIKNIHLIVYIFINSNDYHISNSNNINTLILIVYLKRKNILSYINYIIELDKKLVARITYSIKSR